MKYDCKHIIIITAEYFSMGLLRAIHTFASSGIWKKQQFND